ncbi:MULTISPECIES: hypothetical protein [Levilactobacillus]|uniref:hypothetical protein n=1 Tax=Levilactobacillus TaxID=2767886 RepID=UPI003757B589
MKKHLLVAVLAAVSLGLGVSNAPINAQAKTLSTLPKALRGNWKKHLGWGHYKQNTWEKAYTVDCKINPNAVRTKKISFL